MYNPLMLSYVGEGLSAVVYRIIGTNSVIKVYKENAYPAYIAELRVYKKIMENTPKHFVSIEEYGKDYIKLPFIKGKTFYQKVLDCEYIERGVVDSVYSSVECLMNRGLYPNDLHLKNIIEEEHTGNVFIIDVSRYLDEEKDGRFFTLYEIYIHRYKTIWKHRTWFGNPKNILRMEKLYRIFEHIKKRTKKLIRE